MMRLAWLALVVLAAGCGGGGDDTTGPIVLCNRSVTISVVGSTQPFFTWRPNCLASELLVLGTPTSQGAQAQWWIQSNQGFPSGVTYGVVPAGAQQYQQAAPAPFPAGSTVNLQDANGDRIGSAPIPP
jgi:hypothetical protein